VTAYLYRVRKQEHVHRSPSGIKFNITLEPNSKSVKDPNSKIRLFTAEQLALHNGSDGSYYVAILGEVFEVSQDYIKYYIPKFGPFHYLVGKVGTRAFVTGIERCLLFVIFPGGKDNLGFSDDATGLEPEDIHMLYMWLKHFREDYKRVGRLIGLYYDANGVKTNVLIAVKDWVLKAQAIKNDIHYSISISNPFPDCNSHYLEGEGYHFWCDAKVHGHRRNWTGYPRLFFNQSNQNRKCVCVDVKALLTSPQISTYPECPATSIQCAWDHEQKPTTEWKEDL